MLCAVFVVFCVVCLAVCDCGVEDSRLLMCSTFDWQCFLWCIGVDTCGVCVVCYVCVVFVSVVWFVLCDLNHAWKPWFWCVCSRLCLVCVVMCV